MGAMTAQPEPEFKKGQRYKIQNGTGADGAPIMEGVATLVLKAGSGSNSNYWMVRFDDEPDALFPRFVDPALRV